MGIGFVMRFHTPTATATNINTDYNMRANDPRINMRGMDPEERGVFFSFLLKNLSPNVTGI